MFGAKKRAHHRQQEQMRAETRERDIREQAQRDFEAQQAALRQMQEQAAAAQMAMLKQIEESSRQPYQVKTNEDTVNPILGLRNKTANKKRNVNDLRIARNATVNVGGNAGTNMG